MLTKKLHTPKLKGPHGPTTEVKKRSSGSDNRLARRQLDYTLELFRKSNCPTIRPLLPLLLNLKGEPYSIKDHFPFEPIFRTRMAQKTLVCSGRQVAKSTNAAAQVVAMSACRSHFSSLCVTPLFEQIRRFSSNYVKPFIEQSPISGMLVNSNVDQSVLQRTFTNGSKIIFSFSGTDASRIRGISADLAIFDEMQDIDWSLLGVIREIMSHSSWRVERYTGTPKTLDNPMELLWQQSSMAEWCIRCVACNHWNIPALDHDLLKMIGPFREDISMDAPGVVCSKCRRPITPHTGRWIHAKRELRYDFEGYHIPQIILPIHYASPSTWRDLLRKQFGDSMSNHNTFLNEVLGVSSDRGSKLITKTELIAASVGVGPNKRKAAVDKLEKYTHRVLGIDWGGGGDQETSFTTYAVLGILTSGQVEVIYGHRSMTPHDHLREAVIARDMASMFQCQLIAHDYSGAGDVRESFLLHAGASSDSILALQYQAVTARPLMYYNPPSAIRSRGYYTLDKTRSLQLTIQCIKLKHIRFFDYDFVSKDNPGLSSDFLSLIEEKRESKPTSDRYCIIKQANTRDDFAHSVNFAACALWRLSGSYPNLSQLAGFHLHESQHAGNDQPPIFDWDDPVTSDQTGL